MRRSSATTSSRSAPSGRCATCRGASCRRSPSTRARRRRQARRRDVWRSVVTQQLQADELAVEMAAQLFSIAPDHEAKLYYTTMVQDESRHTEAWLKLIDEAGGWPSAIRTSTSSRSMTLDADTLEEKVFLMQVFFERLIIPRFRMIARSSRGTVLEDLCNRLAVDDGIHHGAGMAYERVLLERRREEDQGASSSRPPTGCCRCSSSTRSGGRASARGSASAMRSTDIARLRERARERHQDRAVARARRERHRAAAARCLAVTCYLRKSLLHYGRGGALKAIVVPRRRQILRLVRDEELSAGEIAAHFDVTRPAVSQHLTLLKEAGLVHERRNGTRRLYRARRRGSPG